MLKTLFIMLCVYWGIRFFRKMTMPVFRDTLSPQPKSQPQTQALTELVRDPVCETYIEKTTAIYRNNNYFCSEACAVKFKERAA